VQLFCFIYLLLDAVEIFKSITLYIMHLNTGLLFIALEVGTVNKSSKGVMNFPRSGNRRGSRWQNVRNEVQLSSRAIEHLTAQGN
jgi:hypothetical protein